MQSLLPFLMLIFVSMTLIGSYYVFNFVSEVGNAPNTEVLNVEIITDKTEYHSGEEMVIRAIVYSSKSLENASLKLEGIEGKLNMERKVNLDMGINEFEFRYRLPPCNACGGIRAGNHTIKCSVTYNNSTAEVVRSVRILQ